MESKEYVIFGMSGLFGDYADIVHLTGGLVKKVVINLPEDTMTGPKTFRQRLDDYNALLAAGGTERRAEFQPLREFSPEAGELYVIGFRGLHVGPLREHLTRTLGLKIEPLVHPSAVVSPTVTLAEGIIINQKAVVGANAVLGEYSLLNTSSHVAHDCRIEAYANIGPGVMLASNVHVGRGAAVGIGASVNEDLKIGEQAFVAAGAAVTRDVDPFTLVAGVPAVKKKDLPPRSVPDGVPGLD